MTDEKTRGTEADPRVPYDLADSSIVADDERDPDGIVATLFLSAGEVDFLLCQLVTAAHAAKNSRDEAVAAGRQKDAAKDQRILDDCHKLVQHVFRVLATNSPRDIPRLIGTAAEIEGSWREIIGEKPYYKTASTGLA